MSTDDQLARDLRAFANSCSATGLISIAATMRGAADKIENLRWALAEVRKEVSAVTPDWNRALRIMDQAGV